MLQGFNQVLGHILLLPTKVAMLNHKECIHQDKGVTLPLKGTLPLKDILPLRAILHLRAILLLRASLRLEAIHPQSLSNLCQVVNHRLLKVSYWTYKIYKWNLKMGTVVYTLIILEKKTEQW